MKRVIHYLFAFVTAVSASLPCWADFSEGERLNHVLSVCLDKEDAVKIVDTKAEKGIEAAQALWVDMTRCNNVPVNGYIVGKIVHRKDVVIEGEKKTALVVEVLGPNGVLGYFLTTQVVHEKPERNS